VGAARFTRLRAELLALLDEVGAFRTPLQLYRDRRGRGAGIGLTTVYRDLQWLYDAGEPTPCECRPASSCSAGAGATHHHHLVCRTCAAAVEVCSPAMESWAVATGSDNGFTDVSHTLEIFGLCSYCSPRLHPA